MEDLATFIQSMSEKYGLLDPAGNKIGTTATSHLLHRKTSQTADSQDDVDQEDQAGGGLGLDPSWECLSAFLNSHEVEANKHEQTRKKSPMAKQIKPSKLQDRSHEDDDESPALIQPGSGSSDRAASFATIMKTSDLIHNASFLDELQNSSLSDDLQSTGMTKGRGSLDPADKETDHCSGQSSLLQEFLTSTGDDLDDLVFAKDIGLSSFDELPQKEDARWQTSELWFRDYCSSRSTTKSYSERSARSVRSDPKVAADQEGRLDGEFLAHDVMFSSGSSSSPATELDGQVEDCNSAAASDCGVAAAGRSRCESPEGFAAALESVERGRERAVLVNARVEKMLEESGADHGDGASMNRLSHEEFVVDVVRVTELGYGVTETGTAGSAVKQRVADIDEASKMLLAQLDKSRSLMGPASLQTSSSSRRRSPATSHPRRAQKLDAQLGSFNEDHSDRSEQDQDGSPRQRSYVDEDGDMMPSRLHLQRKGLTERRGSQERREEDHDPGRNSAGCQEEGILDPRRASPRPYQQSGRYPRRVPSQDQQEDYEPRRASSRDQEAGNEPRMLGSSWERLDYDTRRAKSPGHQQEDDDNPSRASPRRQEVDYPYHDLKTSSSRDQQDFDHRRASPRNQQEFHQDQDSRISASRDQLQGYNPRRASSRNPQVDHDSRRASPRREEAADPHDPRRASPKAQQDYKSQSCRASRKTQQDHKFQSCRASPKHLREDYDIRGASSRDPQENFSDGPRRASPRDKRSSEGVVRARAKDRSRDYHDIAKSWETTVWNEGDEEEEEEEEEGEEVMEPADSSRPSECHSKWTRINDLLCQNGFPPIRSLSPTSEFDEELYLVLADVLNNYGRREKLIQVLLEESEELRQADERNHLHMQQLESESDVVKQKLAASEQRAEVASEAAERNYAAVRRDCQKLESSNANLLQRCSNSQLEHACRAKERTLQKLQDKVRVSLDKEERHRRSDKEMYEKLKHKVASTQRTNGEVLEPNFLQRDLKPAQIVGMYERQRAAMESEIATLRAENAQLCRDLCEKENVLLSKVLGTDDTKKALQLLTRKLQSQMEEKDEEIRRLQHELQSRPTVEELEESARVASACQQKGQLSDGHGREQGYAGKVLQQVCQLLELDEPRGIVETLESLLLLVSAVPRMEQFVGDVCNIVFCDGQNWSHPSEDNEEVARTPDAVPGILQTWLQKLETSSELHTFKESIVSLLWKKDAKSSAAQSQPAMSCQVAVGCVKNLIEVENEYLLSKASYRDADAIVKAEPQTLLHRLLAHFQMLFEIPQLEGVMAVMNSVYIQCSEYHNFARALCSMLGLDKDAGPNTIISAVNSLLTSRVMSLGRKQLREQ